MATREKLANNVQLARARVEGLSAQLAHSKQQVSSLTTQVSAASDTRERALDSVATSREQARNIRQNAQESTSQVTHLRSCLAAANAAARRAEARASSLAESLEFSTVESRLHADHCQRRRTEANSRLTDLQQEYDGVNFRLSTVSRAYASEEAQHKTIKSQLALERRRHRSTIASYRAGMDVSDTFIETLVDDNSGLEYRLSLVSRAYAAEEAVRKKLEAERDCDQLAIASYRVGQRTSDSFIDHLMATTTSPPEFVEGSSRDGIRTQDLDQAPFDDSFDSASSTGNTTSNTPALIRSRSFSRSPSTSPAPMTPGSAVLPRVLKKPETDDVAFTGSRQ